MEKTGDVDALADRNTPTYVGTTARLFGQTFRTEEHPHVCGDNGRCA